MEQKMFQWEQKMFVNKICSKKKVPKGKISAMKIAPYGTENHDFKMAL